MIQKDLDRLTYRDEHKQLNDTHSIKWANIEYLISLFLCVKSFVYFCAENAAEVAGKLVAITNSELSNEEVGVHTSRCDSMQLL